MQTILLQHVPDAFREFVAANAEVASRTVEALTRQYFEAVRNFDYTTEARTYKQLAELCCPDNPAIRIVGGSNGYVLYDESRVRFMPQR
jgi:hypothetical protein